MTLADWNQRYLEIGTSAGSEPSQLVLELTSALKPGTALDLASGAGRNSLFLESAGWRVTAVDGAEAAIRTLQERSERISALVADLAGGSFHIEPNSWDLILSCYYFQHSLIPAVQAGVRTGGLVVVIAHLNEPGEAENPKRVGLGELERLFEGWDIIHSYEGPPRDREHKRKVAEIAARRV